MVTLTNEKGMAMSQLTDAQKQKNYRERLKARQEAKDRECERKIKALTAEVQKLRAQQQRRHPKMPTEC